MRRSRRTESKVPAIPMVFDRGKAKYFHGRTQVLEDFQELVECSDQEKSGTTFLIQGAPGAGKTALLAECAKHAKSEGWRVAEITTQDIWDTAELHRSLGLKKKNTWGTTVKAGIKGFIEVGVRRGAATSETVKTLLHKCEEPVLLILDEAQMLEMVVSSDRAENVGGVLNTIHNARMGKAVILLAAGLGRTKEVLNTLGISRFGGGAFVELGSLDKESEHAVLHDWLTKDGAAKEDPEDWVHAIAQKTHGWPQHMLAYIKPALAQLRLDEGAITKEGLKVVLEKGGVARAAYYEHRADGITRKQRRSLANLFANVSPGESLDREDIVSSLVQDHGAECAQEIFLRAEAKGVITSKEGCYNIPIPSMHNWLVSKYAIEPAKDTPTKSPDQGQEQSRQRTDGDAEKDTKQKGETSTDFPSKDDFPPRSKLRKPDRGTDFGL